MNLESILFIPSHILVRRYEEVHLYDLERDESYIIDNEAYDVLKLVNGKNTLEDILSNYSEDKKDEVQEAIQQFYELDIIQLSFHEITDESVINSRLITLPEKNPFKPPYLKFLMINITEKCNLTCKHCYITDKHQTEIPLDKLKHLITDFYELQGLKIILTGGEPFLYSELRELFEFLRDIPLQKVLLTNGTLINKKEDLLDLIKANNFEVFVSVDGLEESHNDFRDADCFTDTIDGIKTLLEYGITTSINTMIHRNNLEEFEELSNYLKSLGDLQNWTVEVPTFDEETPKDVVEKYSVQPIEGGGIMRNYWWGVSYDSTGIMTAQSDIDDDLPKKEEPPKVPEEEYKEFACGPFMMAVDVMGVVSKCGFFTEKSPGNVFEIGIKESWEGIQNSSNWELKELICKEHNCKHIDDCRGGCRYRAYRCTNNLYGVDPFKCYAFGLTNKEISKMY